MPNSVTVRYGSTGAKQVTSEVDRLKSKLTGIQKQGAKGLLTGFAAGVGLGAINAVGRAIGGVGDKVQELTDAYIEDEHSISKLNQSLKANIANWDGNTKAIERVIQSRVKLGFADEDQRNSLAGLVAATGDVNKALAIQATAMDLARFKGISLADASEALTKVEAGSFRILKSLGIELRAGATQTEALAAVQKVASGQAEAYTQTLEGKLTVAQVRAAETTEKLGEATAGLSVAWNEFWLHSIDPASRSLEDFANSPGWSDLTRAATEAGLSAETAWNLYQNGADLTASSLRLAAAEAADWKEVTHDATGPTNTLARAIEKLGEEGRITDKEIGALADTIENALFGDAINAGNEAQLQQNIADLIKQRAEVKKNSPEWKILTGNIAENQQRLFELHLTQAEAEGPEAAIRFLKSQKVQAGKAADEIARLIKKYQALIQYQNLLDRGTSVTRGGVGGPPPHRASGGPVGAGMAYTVGERGPETFVAPANGAIVPSVSSGGGTTVNINVSGVAMMTPGVTDQLGRMLEPVITRALQRRSQLASAQRF